MALPTEPPPPSSRVHEIQEIIQETLESCGRMGAQVSLTWGAEAQAWFVKVQPDERGAALVSIGVTVRGSLLVTVANTSMDAPLAEDSSDLDWLRSLIGNVSAGRVEEIGRRSDSYVRIGAGRPDATAFGAAHLPLPWALRRVRRFTAYS